MQQTTACTPRACMCGASVRQPAACINANLQQITLTTFNMQIVTVSRACEPNNLGHTLDRRVVRLQETAGRLFADRTVLTIAHRLDAVIEADTVVVMEAGKVAETGPCSQLLSNPASWFSQLVDATGPVEASILRATARRHFNAAGR